MNVVIVVLVILLLMGNKPQSYTSPGAPIPVQPIPESKRCSTEFPQVKAGWIAAGYTFATLPFAAKVAFAIRFGKCPGYNSW